MPDLRRRPIEERDLETVAVLLATGFPERSIAWWRHGLDRLRRRDTPNGYPRYGRLLVFGEEAVGVLLTIHAAIPAGPGGALQVRRNLSSWYVAPAYAAHAPLLLSADGRDKVVTSLNISPAPHTQPIIEAQGFRPFAAGSLATVPILARRRAAGRVRRLRPGEAAGWFDETLLADHGALGCLCLIAEADDGPQPFVFSPPRRLVGLLPGAHLLYCRDIAAFARFAAPLGAVLARRGTPVAVVDGLAVLPGIPGRRFNLGQKKYVAGPHVPRVGDLAYTELAIFH